MHFARGIQGFLYSRKKPGLYHTLCTGHDRFLAHSFHLYIFSHSPVIWLSATLFTRYSTASFAAHVFIFIPTQTLIAFVAVIQTFVPHRMTCSILKTFFDLSAYLAENTVSHNILYWVLTSFVGKRGTARSHKDIRQRDFKRETENGRAGEGRRSVGRHATMLLQRAFGVRVTVCVVVHSQLSDSVVKLTAWHRNAGASPRGATPQSLSQLRQYTQHLISL
jgi:hypothetical protein